MNGPLCRLGAEGWDRHTGAIARFLHHHHLDADTGWSAERLLHALEIHLRTLGQSVPDPGKQRNPLGYLHTLLTAAQPRLPAGLLERRPVAAWRREDAARREQLAVEDPAVRAAIIAQIRADIAREQYRDQDRS